MEAESDAALLERYGRLREAGRLIHIYGEIDGVALQGFRKAVAASEANSEDLIVTLDTQGGMMSAALSLYQDLKVLAATRDLRMIAQTRVHSSGMLLLAAIQLERRFALAPTSFLIHPPTYEYKLVIDGTLERHEDAIRSYQLNNEDVRRRDERMKELIGAGMGHSFDRIVELAAAAEFIDERRALELGFVSRILEW